MEERMKGRRARVWCFRGVYFHKRTGKFSARCIIEGKSWLLGYFVTAKEASFCYETIAELVSNEAASRLRLKDGTR
jgi:hypothetical protein